jgi:hypothetical protein
MCNSLGGGSCFYRGFTDLDILVGRTPAVRMVTVSLEMFAMKKHRRWHQPLLPCLEELDP